MLIRENLWITKNKKGEIKSNFSGVWKVETEPNQIAICEKALSMMQTRKNSDETKQLYINKCIKAYQDLMTEEEKQNNDAINAQKIKDVCYNLINFFKDFFHFPNLYHSKRQCHILFHILILIIFVFQKHFFQIILLQNYFLMKIL